MVSEVKMGQKHIAEGCESLKWKDQWQFLIVLLQFWKYIPKYVYVIVPPIFVHFSEYN